MSDASVLAVGLAHDLRNLISVVESSAFLAKRADTGASPVVTKHLARIAEAARDAQALLSAVLGLARGDVIVNEVVDLRSCADQVVHALDAADRVSVDGEALDAMAHPTLVRAALLNLVKNGLEAGARVTVSIGRAEALVSIDVHDDGPGFSEGFEIVAGSSTKASGAGLGLVMARALTEAQGGALVVRAGAGGGVSLRLRAAS